MRISILSSIRRVWRGWGYRCNFLWRFDRLIVINYKRNSAFDFVFIIWKIFSNASEHYTHHLKSLILFLKYWGLCDIIKTALLSITCKLFFLFHCTRTFTEIQTCNVRVVRLVIVYYIYVSSFCSCEVYLRARLTSTLFAPY